MTDRTIRLHRVLATKPEKVYRAFLDADAKAKWLPPNGFTCKLQAFEPKVGMRYKASFTNFTTGETHGWTGAFTELVPNQRLRYTDTFDDPAMPGEMVVTVTLREVSCGTELQITQENVPALIPLEGCYLGWQESLVNLARLVEPELRG